MIRSALRNLLPVHTFGRSARLFLLATMIDGLILSAWQLFFNFFVLARGYDRDFLGLVNSLPSIAALLFGLPLGVLSDRIGRRRAILLGLTVYTIAMGLQVLGSQAWILLVMAFIGGLGSTLYTVSQAPFMMKASDNTNRALLFSLNYGLVTLAGSVGNLFAGQLPAVFGKLLQAPPTSAQAYQAVLVVSVALGSLALIPIYLIREARGGEDTSQINLPRKGFRDVLRQAVVWRLVLPNWLIGMGAAILIPYMNLFFSDRFLLSPGALGALFGLSNLLTGAGSVVGPRLAANLNSKIRTVVLTQGISLVFLLIAGFSPWFTLAAAGFLVRTVLMNMASPLYSAFAMELVDEAEQGIVNSLLNLSWMFGYAFGPMISGAVQQRFGFGPLFLSTAALYGGAAVLEHLFFRGRDAQHPSAAQEEPLGAQEARP